MKGLSKIGSAVILAAGRGSRMRQEGVPKPLIRFMGMPLIERSIRALHSSGIGRFVVVTGYRGEEVARFVTDLGGRLGVEVVPVENRRWREGNGTSLLAAQGVVDGPFVLAMADHLLSLELIEGLLAAGNPGQGLVLAVDTCLENGLIDPADVTRVYLGQGAIRAIAKGLDRYNGYDTGLFLCSPAIFPVLEELVAKGEAQVTALVRALAAQGRARAVELHGPFWADLDDPAAFRRAERAMLKAMKGKHHDGPVSRFLNRPISIELSRRLVWTGVTPNQVTVASFLLALAAAFLLSRPSYLWFAAGGVLAQAASIIDGCDGEIARMKWLQSDYGAWLDAVLDRYADACLLTGITWHVANYRLTEAWAWLLGLLAIVGSLINSYTADKYDGWVRRRGMAHRFRLGRDVRIFLVMLSSLLYRPVELLAILAGLMNAENVRRIWAMRRA